MLVTSIFSFSQSVIYLFRREIIISETFNLSSANAFNLVTSKSLSFGKGLKDKILVLYTLKVFADDLNFTRNARFSFTLRRNIVGKGENIVHQHFLFPAPPAWLSGEHVGLITRWL